MFRTNKTPVLQEKSASGAVASFNTALAMPLPSCKIAVNAWQEGSGDSSPSNVRPIHGFSEVNATRAGKNLFDGNFPNPSPTIRYLHIKVNNGSWTLSGNTPANPYLVCLLEGKVTTGASGASAVYENRPKTVNGVGGYITIAYRTFADYNPNDYKFQLEGGNEATSYEPYVTPTIYTIQLGQDVYGGVLDVVNGELVVTKKIVDLSTIAGWVYQANYNRFYSNKAVTDYGMTQDTADMAIFENVITSRNTELPSAFVDGGNRVFFMNTGYTEIEPFLENIINGHYAVVMIKPFDIQLTPQQIETLIGDNTIYADTGDVDLTFNDLDIAKRGSFREVFKLP